MDITKESKRYWPKGRVLALCGGVGGAKLAAGLNALITQPGQLLIAVNTGDDFRHLGLQICPDLDSVLYALSGKNDTIRGWGRADETWHCMEALVELGAASWFALGDKDLAVHIERTRRLQEGQSLSSVTAQFCRQFGVTAHVVPMTDDSVQSLIHTDEGTLPFQDYFVRRATKPHVQGVSFLGADHARPNQALMTALADDSLEAIIICPSNPQLSIDPILSLSGVREALIAAQVPVIAVSPLIGGAAVKGPAAKIMSELGLASNSQAIAGVYQPFLKGLVIDHLDEGDVPQLPLPALVTSTLMKNAADALRLANETLSFASSLRQSSPAVLAQEAR